MNTQISSRRSTSLVMATMLVALGYGAVSAAADADNVPQVVVSYADLNVSSPQGAAALYRRINAAASSVCEQSHSSDYRVDSPILLRKCEHRALRDAVNKVGGRLLIAEYNAHNRKPLPQRAVVAQAQ